MANIKKKKLIELFEKGESFELTNDQYKELTDSDFPKKNGYFTESSAAAKLARQYDYQMELVEAVVVKFTKRS